MAIFNVNSVLLITISIFAAVAYGIDDKCAACNAIAMELERGLSNEKPRNHLDMRHRLDSKGQRQGKLIDYRVSELRVVELLDGLCENMQDYTLEKVDSSRQWIKVKDWDNLKTKIDCLFEACMITGIPFGDPYGDTNAIRETVIMLTYISDIMLGLETNQIDADNIADKQEARAYSKDISSFCGRLLEETEDELSERIKKGSVNTGEVSKVLCQDIGRYCSQTSGNGETVDDETSNEEL